MKKLLVFLLLLRSVVVFSAIPEVTVSSPDGRLRFRLSGEGAHSGGGREGSLPGGSHELSPSDGGHGLSFTVAADGRPVVLTSPLRFLLDDRLVTAGAVMVSSRKYAIHEHYDWLGVHTPAVDDCNGVEVRLAKGKIVYAVDIRVFNDGVAFRIVAPGPDGVGRVPDEATVFQLPGDATIWYHDINGHYEGIHVKKQVGELQAGDWVAPPATIKLSSGYYMAITEANLQNYSGMVMQADGKSGLVVKMAHHQPASHPYVLRYSAEDVARLARPAVVTGTITTPWRVVLVGRDLNTLVNSDVIHDLCPAPDSTLFPQGIHTAFIRPGRAVWKYLDGGGEGSPEVMKHWSDLASQLGFEYNILEGFWRKWTDAQIKDLVEYSRAKHVGIWLWVHSKELHDSTARRVLFEHCHELGVAGLKIDFFDHEHKEVIDLYDAILRETAALGLLVDFHGSNKPTGLSRTYPNEMTREAVKGMEASKLADRATHETTIPFTRLLAGPAEYTVVHFGERRRNTTIAHQLASAVVLGGEPMLTYAANPEKLLASPAVDIIRRIPSDYDETIVLPGSEIGECAAFARRKGADWFIGIMNGISPRRIRIPLRFLGGVMEGLAAMDVFGDTAGMAMRRERYQPGDSLVLDLAPGGGYVAWLHAPSAGVVYNVRVFGAVGDGVVNDRDAIEKAIDAAEVAGGGTVYFPAGNYLSGTIHLKSNISLYIDQGAVLIAAPTGYDPPEPNAFEQYQDFGHSHWMNSLLYGEGLHDISILGPGLIWGKGLTRSTNVPQGGGNKTIALKLCRNVTIRDVSVLHGGHFALLATGVDNLTLDNLKIDTDRDGFDIDCCKNVRVSNCTVNSPFDDGICLKSSFGLGYARATENVTITNCVFDYSRGLALETVDGGLLEDVTISNITMRDIVNAPIFIRLGARMRGPDTIPVGVCRRILLSNIVIYNADYRHGAIISGLPGHPIEDLRMNNIRIYYKGGGTADLASRVVPEFEKDYPEPYRFGKMPAYGFFVRHVRQLDMRDVEVSYLSPEERPAYILEDVDGAVLDHVVGERAGAGESIVLKQVKGYHYSP